MAKYQEGEVQTTSQGTFRVENGQWVPVQQPQQAVASGLPTSPEEVMRQLMPGPPQQIQRQQGLTARAGIEGLTALPSMLAEIPRQALSLIPGVDFPPQQQALSQLLTQAGLPQPETPIERIAGMGAQALTGAGGLIGAGKTLAQSLPQISQTLTAAPAIQALSAGAGGLAAQTAAEHDIGPAGQAAAAIGAGLVAPAAGLGVAKAFTHQSATKQRIGRLLEEGAGDIETAKFKIRPTSKLEKAISSGGPKVQKDKAAVETIRQGFDEGVIASIKGASRTDKRAMLKMVDIMEKGKREARFGMTNRPSDIAGDSFLKRFNVVKNVNQKAGKQLDKVANKLRNKPVNTGDPVGGFMDDLADMGITVETVDGAPQLNFSGSDIDGLDGPMKAVLRVFEKADALTGRDAYAAHRLKRFIDESVTYGKSGEGLSGKTVGVIKSFRRNLDAELDNTFPAYNKVNTKYSETIGVLDSMQDAAGRKMDLTGPSAEKATGQLLRRLMSNAQSRVNLLDTVNDLESMAVKHGGKFDDDLLTQVLFVDELDSVFGPAARTSFQGQISQAVERTAEASVSPVMAGLRAAGKGAEKLRGINQEGAFKSIKSLLRGK